MFPCSLNSLFSGIFLLSCDALHISVTEMFRHFYLLPLLWIYFTVYIFLCLIFRYLPRFCFYYFSLFALSIIILLEVSLSVIVLFNVCHHWKLLPGLFVTLISLFWKVSKTLKNNGPHITYSIIPPLPKLILTLLSVSQNT